MLGKNEHTDSGAPSSPSRRQWLRRTPLAIMAGIESLDVRSSPMALAQSDSNNRHSEAKYIYNVNDFGAKGDGEAVDTDAVQAAINTCSKRGGGMVLLPAGTFKVGSIELKSNITLHISASAKLLGAAEGSKYHAVGAIPLKGDTTLKDGNWALLYAVGAKNITIEGHGMIDGQGAQFRLTAEGVPPPSGLVGTERPYHLLAYQCEGLTVRDLTFVDSAYHSIRVIACNRVHIDGVYIHNRVNVNNDGFHFVSSKFVAIRNCTVLSQDDACALFGSCEFITITNCTFSTRWSVFRFGGGTARNVTVSNCLLFEVYGCPIKFQGSPGSTFENISFSNLILDEVTGPVYISTGPSPGSSTADDPNPAEGSNEKPPAIVRNISFSNISGTVLSAPGRLPDTTVPSHSYSGEALSCIALSCAANAVMENISLANISLTFGGGGTKEQGARRNLPQSGGEYFTLGTMPAYGLYVRGVRGVTLQNIRLQFKSPDVRPAVIFDRVVDAAIDCLSVQSHPSAEAVLRFIDSEDVLVSAPRLLTKTQNFLQIEGGGTKAIIVDGGDISKASVPAIFNSGANATMLTIRQWGVPIRG
jgi:hypothetical protein